MASDDNRIGSGQIMAAEFVGTAVLVMGGPGTAILAPNIGQLGVAFAFGLSLLVMAYAIGPVYKDVIVYALFVAVLWVRPQGLFGKPE